MLRSLFRKGSNGHPQHVRGPDAAGANGFGAPFHQAWGYRPLPGAGAMQWAWETLTLPLYTPIGWGTRNARQFRATQSAAVMVAVQGVTLNPLQGAPIMGQQTGQVTTAPLLDVQQAEQLGIQTPAYSSPPNNFEMPTVLAGA